MPKRTINTLPAEIPAEIPAKYWDKMKALADKLGGVSASAMFDFRHAHEPSKAIKHPVCIIGFAKAVGLVDLYDHRVDGRAFVDDWDFETNPTMLDLFDCRIGGKGYWEFDTLFRQLAFEHGVIKSYNTGDINADTRLPFELVMSNAGLTRAED